MILANEGTQLGILSELSPFLGALAMNKDYCKWLWAATVHVNKELAPLETGREETGAL